jgi:hypothetical protein
VTNRLDLIKVLEERRRELKSELSELSALIRAERYGVKLAKEQFHEKA